MKKEIEQTLKVLVGMPLWGSHRAADLQVFKFGKRIPSIMRATARSSPRGPTILLLWNQWKPNKGRAALRHRSGVPDHRGIPAGVDSMLTRTRRSVGISVIA
jgi:hypothetical protein